MVQWGDPIPVDGKRPDWLRDDGQTIRIINFTGSEDRVGIAADSSTYWGNAKTIFLPFDHPYYVATSKGFTYWPGINNTAPEDWDQGFVLLRDGYELSANFLRYWEHRSNVPNSDIIGYRKRAADKCCNRTVQIGHRCTGCPHDDETSNHMVAAPASYRGEIDPPPVTAEFIALVVNERDALRKRVTDLLEANNRLVEERRASEDWQAAFERSQDELAMVTAERDAYRQEARDYHEREVQRFKRLLDGQGAGDHLTITLSGPQGCGKTRVAEALRNVLRRFGATVVGDGCDDHPGSVMREVVVGKQVTVIDMPVLPVAKAAA